MSNQERLASLFDTHAPDVHRYLRRRVANQSDVDDLTSDVFVIAAGKLDSIPMDFELPWLYNTAGFVLANHRRKLTPISTANDADLDHAEPDPAQAVLESKGLADAWRALSDGEREVLRLAAWEGLTGAKLASALGVSTSAAASALSRARARFAQLCE